jgi:hypothetical protein
LDYEQNQRYLKEHIVISRYDDMKKARFRFKIICARESSLKDAFHLPADPWIQPVYRRPLFLA